MALRKILAFGVLYLITGIFISSPVKAGEEFSSSYNVNYDVDTLGATFVTEQVSLKNLTDRYYASSFSLSIGSTKLEDVSAFDNQGPLEADVKTTGNKTEVNVKFTQQVVGLGKEYNWTLRFKSYDFAQAQGKVWQVTVPKIVASQSMDNYKVVLSVPVSFGDPTNIIPKPVSQSEAGGKLKYTFSKDQLTSSGILANFGTSQLFDFNLTYHLNNNGLLPAIGKVPLPPDTTYQQIEISNIQPKPENVIIDPDGNFIGYFKVDRKSSLEIKVSGLARLFANRRPNFEDLSTAEFKDYTTPQKYWDVDNPQIKAQLSQTLKGKQNLPNEQKAKLINQFVVNKLNYDQNRLKNKDYQRLGALTVLNNPQNALCSEFTDLFIALSRAAGIPARMVTGYAYTSNSTLRPLSFQDNVLHAWPEYYDSESGWVMIDPTWQNTTGGVDYFSKFDLNHLALAIRGSSSEDPLPADSVDVRFSNAQFEPKPGLGLNMEAPAQMYAVFPAKMKVRLQNNSHFFQAPQNLSVSASRVQLADQFGTSTKKQFKTPGIPPFGFLEYNFDLRANYPWQSFDDVLQAKSGDKSVDKTIAVKPFFEYRLFSFGVGATVFVIVLFYFGTFLLHFKTQRKR